ncbi:MAG: GLPGLI family protein [Saprospirales bacterium]|nr:MAG: GLPGLI family protein [Saprospirales bacterium]
MNRFIKFISFHFIIYLLIWTTAAWGQITEGIIIYEVKLNLHAQLPDDMEAMKASIPEFQSMRKELLFNREASLFRDYEEEPGGGRRGWFRMGANEVHHQNLLEGKYTVQRGLLNDEYLIESEVERHPWTLTGRTEMIAGKFCQLAWRMDHKDSTMIEVWFTPEIPLPVGPDNYFGLPGAVLMAVVNYNERIYIATEILQQAVPSTRVAAPTRGKKVTPEEFAEISEEMMEQFRSRMGGGRRR